MNVKESLDNLSKELNKIKSEIIESDLTNLVFTFKDDIFSVLFKDKNITYVMSPYAFRRLSFILGIKRKYLSILNTEILDSIAKRYKEFGLNGKYFFEVTNIDGYVYITNIANYDLSTQAVSTHVLLKAYDDNTYLKHVVEPILFDTNKTFDSVLLGMVPNFGKDFVQISVDGLHAYVYTGLLLSTFRNKSSKIIIRPSYFIKTKDKVVSLMIPRSNSYKNPIYRTIRNLDYLVENSLFKSELNTFIFEVLFEVNKNILTYRKFLEEKSFIVNKLNVQKEFSDICSFRSFSSERFLKFFIKEFEKFPHKSCFGIARAIAAHARTTTPWSKSVVLNAARDVLEGWRI